MKVRQDPPAHPGYNGKQGGERFRTILKYPIATDAIFKSKSTRLLSAFLAVLMVVAMLPVTAFAWTAEEGTKCTSTYGDLYLASDGDNYYSKTGNTLFYNDDGSFYVSPHNGGVARYKYLMIDANGNYNHV